MKKTLSFILALALVISLVTSVVFAEGETAEATDIIAEFSETYIKYKTATENGKRIGNNHAYILDENQINSLPDGVNGVIQFEGDYSLLYEQMYSTFNTAKHKSYKFTPIVGSEIRAMRFMTSRSNSKITRWIDDVSKNGGKFAFSMPLTQAGWYDVKIDANRVNYGSSYYVYVNGQYAGIYDANSADTAVTNYGVQSLNKLYLEPTENDTVEVVFCLAEEKYESGTDAWLLLYKFILSPADKETAEFDRFETNIPDVMKVGDTAEVTVSAYTTDGEIHRANGRNLADATENDDLKIEAVYGDSVTVVQESRDLCEGVAKATFTANKVGETEITYSTVINGETYTETKRIWVLDESGSQPTIDVKMTYDEIIYSEETKKADAIDTWVTHGFDIVLDKTVTANNHRRTNFTVSDGKITSKIPQIAVSQTSWAKWPGSQQCMFTISKNIPVAGYYAVNFQGGLWVSASQFAIYVNEEYAGDYNCYDTTSAASPFKLGDSKTLNTIYLPSGDVEISFRVRKPYTWASNFMPYKLTLTPATKADATLASVTTSMKETFELSNGGTFAGTAQAIMGDGSVRSFGYTDSGATPNIKNEADDVINVTSSNEDVVSVKTVCVEADINKDTTQTIDPTTTEFTLTANNPGTAVITVTAQVNGETKTAISTVTVPYTDGSEAAQEDVSYIVRGAEAAFNGGINMTGYTAGEVGSHTLGTSFTASAEKEITVEDKKYNFAYWQTAGGTPIEDAGASYTFFPKSNFTLEAVYVPAEPTTGAAKKVQFWNYNRVYLGDETVTDGKVTKMPDDPTLAGHTFTGWAAENIGTFTEDTQLTAALTRVVAQFTADADKYSVKVDGVEVDKYAYGATFETTADETKDTQVFSHWAIGDKVVSYKPTISFCVWNDVELTAVYEGEKTAVPTVVLDKVNDDEYFILYEVPEGYTAIDAGIVFGTMGTTPRVDSTDGSKASAAKLTGQFTAAPGDDSHTVARGYVMYKVNTTGETRVIYSN